MNVIRETELGQAREEEAARWRHDMAQQRGELDRLYSERLKHVRELEDAAALRAGELQRAAERAAFDMRQRMVAEDDRMRATLQVLLLAPFSCPANAASRLTCCFATAGDVLGCPALLHGACLATIDSDFPVH